MRMVMRLVMRAQKQNLTRNLMRNEDRKGGKVKVKRAKDTGERDQREAIGIVDLLLRRIRV